MDLFVQKIPSTLFSKMMPKITPRAETCIHKLYHMLKKAEGNRGNIEHMVEINTNILNVNNYVKMALAKYNNGSVHYFPEKTVRNVEEMAERIIKVVFKLPNRTIDIFFIMDSENFSVFSKQENLNTYLSHLKTWFGFLDDIASDACAKTLNIHIYLSNEKKALPSLPGDIIGVEHVNSAFSNVCERNGEIVIYRKEEWFKVLIHETLHNYGIDFSLMDQSKMATHLFNVFPIGANIDDALFSETYTETWAELINTAIIALDLDEDDNINTFSLYFHFLTQIELFHSMAQTKKILYHFDLSYDSLFERKSAKRYKQSSHVFEYYILKTVLLSNYGDFLCWANDNMRNMIIFPDEERKLLSFCELLEKLAEISNMRQVDMINLDMYHDKNLRMSICEI